MWQVQKQRMTGKMTEGIKPKQRCCNETQAYKESKTIQAKSDRSKQKTPRILHSQS